MGVVRNQMLLYIINEFLVHGMGEPKLCVFKKALMLIVRKLFTFELLRRGGIIGVV